MSPAVRPAVDRFLAHLHLNRERQTLDYLHRIIREHQLPVLFETLTKLIDYVPALRRGDFRKVTCIGDINSTQTLRTSMETMDAGGSGGQKMGAVSERA